MINLNIYQVDAFSNTLFGGNPAAVCPLKTWLSDELMQKIALENNLSETAFFVAKDDVYELRWFTPTTEVDLCGHATLATAHVLFEHLGYSQTTIQFHSPRSGALAVSKNGDWYTMDFPTDSIVAVSTPKGMVKALGIEPIEVYKGKSDYLVLIDSQESLEKLTPDFALLKKVDEVRGVIVTAKGNTVDFVSRGFFPQVGINEDPATGSAHTTLTPYWANRLQKNTFTAKQISQRGGTIKTVFKGERTEISGQAITYLSGVVRIR